MMRKLSVPMLALVVLTAGCTPSTPDAPGSQSSTAARPSATTPASSAPATSSATASDSPATPEMGPGVQGSAGLRDIDESFTVTEHARFDSPWAMAFLPGTDWLAITDRGGSMVLFEPGSGRTIDVEGLPEVHVDGQGGLGDIVPAPTFESDNVVYLSWVEEGDGGTGAAMGRAELVVNGGSARLEGLETIWRQVPKTSGRGHFSHRIVFSPDGKYLFLSSGERQKKKPAQDLSNNLGKILRLNLDGSPAEGNPFADRGGPAAEIWSYGHRNPLGLDFDAAGNLWSTEMGPEGGDEVNVIMRGANYGWPEASNGSDYGGDPIPDHAAGDGFVGPRVWWTPSISPSGLLIYDGDMFQQWRGDAFLGALSGKALSHLDIDGLDATEADRWTWGERVREVEQGPDGSIWVLEDAGGGRLLQLTAR